MHLDSSEHVNHLQIGYRSLLRGSQSVSDLSTLHDSSFGTGHLQDRPGSSAAIGSRGNKVKSSTLTTDLSPPGSGSNSRRLAACTATASTKKSAAASTPLNNGIFTTKRHRTFENFLHQLSSNNTNLISGDRFFKQPKTEFSRTKFEKTNVLK